MSLPKNILQFVESLNYDQLHEMNHFIVERLRLLSRTKSMMAINKFQLLDKVYFFDGDNRKVGTIVRLNQKTVSIKTEDNQYWRVSPNIVTKFIEANEKTENVEDIPPIPSSDNTIQSNIFDYRPKSASSKKGTKKKKRKKKRKKR